MCEQERRMCISQQEFLGISELGGGFMKVKSGFKLMKVGVQNLVVAVDERAEEFNGMVRLNSTGAFLWEKIEKGSEKEELVSALLAQYGIDEETARRAVEIYRERYAPVGIYENELYPGIPEMLEGLKARGYKLGIASSKPENFV